MTKRARHRCEPRNDVSTFAVLVTIIQVGQLVDVITSRQIGFRFLVGAGCVSANGSTWEALSMYRLYCLDIRAALRPHLKRVHLTHKAFFSATEVPAGLGNESRNTSRAEFRVQSPIFFQGGLGSTRIETHVIRCRRIE